MDLIKAYSEKIYPEQKKPAQDLEKDYKKLKKSLFKKDTTVKATFGEPVSKDKEFTATDLKNLKFD